MHCRIPSCSVGAYVCRLEWDCGLRSVFQRSICADRPFWQHHAALIVQGGPKVGVQYKVYSNYCIPTFGPLCSSSKGPASVHSTDSSIVAYRRFRCTVRMLFLRTAASCPVVWVYTPA